MLSAAADAVVVNPLEMGLPQLSTAEARLLSESRLFFQGDEWAEAETLRRWWGFLEAAAEGEAMSCGWLREGELLEPWMGARPMLALWLLLVTAALSVASSLSGLNLGFGGGLGGATTGDDASWCCLLCCFSLFTSSEVNWIVFEVPPRNFSQPGASARSTEFRSLGAFFCIPAA